MVLLNTGRKKKVVGKEFQLVLDIWFGNARKMAIWTFLSSTRILHLEAQRRGRE